MQSSITPLSFKSLSAGFSNMTVGRDYHNKSELIKKENST